MIFRANEIVRDLQARIVHALAQGGVRFALSGSNATFVWIASVDKSAVRQYRNVELIICRNDLGRVKTLLTALNLIMEERPDHVLIRSASFKSDRWTSCAVFADEVLLGTACKVPSLALATVVQGIPVLDLQELVILQLSRWLLDDQVDVRDMIDVGLLDRSWLNRLPPELASHLQELLDNSDG